jgi:hypothetical protein
VNAAPASFSFWESIGFIPDQEEGHTHILPWIIAYDAHGPDGLRVIKSKPLIDHRIAERDEWRAAKLLIRRHGAHAHDEATRLANLVIYGDTWQSRWARILLAIEALQARGA